MSIDRWMDKEDMERVQWDTQPKKKNKIMSFVATWIELEIIMLNEISEKERKISYGITYMWNLKYDTIKTLNETETSSQT